MSEPTQESVNPDPLLRGEIIAVGLVSFSLIALQIVLMQMLAFAQGHHLAYVVISVALLGFGASGSVLYVWRALLAIPARKCLVPSLLLCGLCTAGLVPMVRPLLADIEVDLLKTDPGQWLRLGGLGLLLLLPFFFGASAIAITFTTRAAAIGLLYGSNLLGSALGAGGVLLLLTVALPEDVLPLLGLGAVVAAIFARTRPCPGFERGAVACIILAILGTFWLPGELPLSDYKGLSYARQMPDTREGPPIPHPLGRVDRIASRALRHAPDLSLQYTGPVPSPENVFVNGETYAHLLAPDAPAADILRHTPRGFPFRLDDMDTALLLAPGGTPAINLARAHGVEVTAIEPHPEVAALTADLVAEDNGVRISVEDPRAFLTRAGGGAAEAKAPDWILFPERGYFGGPVGLQALGEDFLFTVEAVEMAYQNLSEKGFLVFTVWIDEPLRHSLRVIDLVASALRRRGVDAPGEHLAMVRGWGSITLVAGKDALDAENIENIRAFAEEGGFDVIWPPPSGGATRLHGSTDDRLEEAIAALLGPDRADFHERYRFNVRAPTDNRPFFNQFLHPRDTLKLMQPDRSDLAQLSLSEKGLVFVVVLVGLLALGTLVLVLGPLVALRRPVRRPGFTLIYFAALGAGFMFIEIGLIQRFTLLWGSPLHSAAAVITILLCGMGLGSAFSQRLQASGRRLFILTAVIALLQAAILIGAAPLFDLLLTVPKPIAIAMGLALLLPPAFLLGIPFPLGMRLLAKDAADQIPWAWGINGCFSVLTSSAAGLLALMGGFNALTYAAGIAYLLAGIVALKTNSGATV